jgi:tetratricopeptide (TPR) repeat protein
MIRNTMIRNATIRRTTTFEVIARRTAASLLGIGLLLAAVAGLAQQPASQPGNPLTAVLPLTTKSPEARRLVEEALSIYLDKVEQAQAIEILRKAVKVDPDFAMGHEFLAQISLDSAEQVSEQEKAFATRYHATSSEQMVIEWYQDAADHLLIPAITHMNDVLSQYPRDKWVVWMTTWWLQSQSQYDRVIAVYEHSGITDSPGLINNIGYNYAYLRQFDKAFEMMDKYVALMPNDSNPQDSYAEILRLAGRFNQSIEHYRASLVINPQFYSSQFGMADTYSLMGDQVRARKEYEIGFQKFILPELQQILWRTREAATYVREGDNEGAERAFQVIADYAHSRQNSQAEADTYRQIAMCQQNPKQALVFLGKAEAATQDGKNALKIAITQELAQILRARVEVALKIGNKELANSNLTRLAAMSESANDKLIELAYHGAAGAVLSSEHKYDKAISDLEEDTTNPFSLKLLAVAYQKIGYSAGAKRTTETLTNLNDPTLEQALVVPAFRKCGDGASCNGDAKSAELKR